MDEGSRGKRVEETSEEPRDFVRRITKRTGNADEGKNKTENDELG